MGRGYVALLLGVCIPLAACALDWSVPEVEGGARPALDAGTIDATSVDGDESPALDGGGDTQGIDEASAHDDCGEGAACDANSVCAASMSSGCTVEVIRCVPRADVCDLGAVCGCDGVLHADECAAIANGTQASTDGTCNVPTNYVSCGRYYCARPSQWCVPGDAKGRGVTCATDTQCAGDCNCLGEKFCGGLGADSCAGGIVNCNE